MNERPSRIQLRAVALLAAMLVAAALALGFLGSVHPAFDAFSHFRAHFAVILLMIAIALAIGRERIHALVATTFAAGALATTLGASMFPGLGTAQAALTPPIINGPVYRLLQLNLRFDNQQPNEVLSLIGRVRPDVITVNEVSPLWVQKLGLLAAAYPHRVHCPGIAILSRRPFDQNSEPRCLKSERFATARVNLGGQIVEVAAIHLRWPWPYEQANHLDRLADSIANLDETALLAGDFNAASWSATMRRVEKIGNLKQIEGIGVTWQALALPRWFKPAGLPIDHVLAKGAIDIRSAQTLESVGSDHWPVLVEFTLRPKPQQPEEPATAQSAETTSFL